MNKTLNKMCFLKIMCYELRRTLLNRLFLGLFLVNGLCAWFILSFDTIMGTAYTAPFSVWSYCAYLGRTLPIATVTTLFLLSNYYSRKQKQVEILTDATPVTPFCQIMVRTLTAGIGFVLIYVVMCSLARIFYVRFFRFRDFAVFILPSVLLLLPCFTFFAGVGQLLGSLHRGLIYALMLLVLIFRGIPSIFDCFGAGYFSTFPLTLPVGADGEPAFRIGLSFIMVRVLYLLTGIASLCLATALSARKSRNA